MYESSSSSGNQAASWSPEPVSSSPLVVYTAITDGYDSLKEPPAAAAAHARFVAFLEAPQASENWRAHPMHRDFRDPNRNAKIHKILPHLYLPDADYSLWIDGSVAIVSAEPIARLIDLYLTDRDLAVFRHRQRTCVYQEANVCLLRRLDEPEVIWQQVCRYTREGYPANAGLAECPVILRRHTSAVNAFNEAWWEEIARGSRRDQLSFDYVARRVGLRYAVLSGTIADNPWFRRGPHVVPRPETLAEPPALAPEAKLYRSPRLPRPRKKIAFGTVRNEPSWSWVGFETARELAKDYDVVLSGSAATVPDCDVLLYVKKRPSEGVLARAREKGTRLVYCPIDRYASEEEIEDDADLLRACAMILVHCERLLPRVRPYCANVHFVDHHARHALHEMASYKEDGFILWLGSYQYVPYLVAWLQHHPIDREIRILSDFDNENAVAKARRVADEMGLDIELSRDATLLAGHRVYRWSERSQGEMMAACKAAIDVKMTLSFCQYHKPPTKAQQYVASGVPFAVNADSYSAEYFRTRGFEVASPDDTARWLSREYWEATRAAGERLRAATSLETVAARYRELIESL